LNKAFGLMSREKDPTEDFFNGIPSQTEVVQCLPRLVDDVLIVQAPYHEAGTLLKQATRRTQNIQPSHTLQG